VTLARGPAGEVELRSQRATGRNGRMADIRGASGRSYTGSLSRRQEAIRALPENGRQARPYMVQQAQPVRGVQVTQGNGWSGRCQTAKPRLCRRLRWVRRSAGPIGARREPLVNRVCVGSVGNWKPITVQFLQWHNQS